jgi:hypothetical protein
MKHGLIQHFRTTFARALRTAFDDRATARMSANSSLEFDVEFLEQRKLLAGDVSAAMTAAGDLVIRGDNLSNNIEITPNANGIVVRGRDGTRINGANVRSFAGTVEDLQINLRNGDNVVQICGVEVTGDIVIRTGRGNDAVVVRIVEVGDEISINTKAGDDIIALGSPRIADDLKVIAGSGNDAVIMDGGDVAGNVLFVTGSGDDSVGLSEDMVIRGNASLRTGSGNDFAGIGLDNVEVRGQASAVLGGGNDTLILSSDTEFFGPTRASGGGGRGDNIINHPDAFLASTPSLSGFEGVSTSTQTDALIRNHFEPIGEEFFDRIGSILVC